MRTRLSLLLVVLFSLTMVSCEKASESSSLPLPEINSQPSSSQEANELEIENSGLSDSEKMTLEILRSDYKQPPHDKPSWALGKTGIDLYYDYVDGIQNTAPVPIESDGPGIPQPNAIYVTLETTVVAYRPAEGADTLKILASHDKAETWETSELPIEELGKYSYYYIAFRDKDNGILILSDGENNGITYSTTTGGNKWSLDGSFVPPEIFYEISSFSGHYYIVGRDNAYPIVAKSNDGVLWEKKALPFDKDTYVKGDCVYTSFSDNVGLAVVTAYTAEDNICWLNFATVDYGENWVLYAVD